MPQVERQNEFCPALDGGREDVTVAWIGQSEIGDPIRVACDIRAGQDPLHNIAGAYETLSRHTARSDQIFNPLLVDRIGPSRLNDVVYAELDEKIP
jgi:hypothetical protein